MIDPSIVTIVVAVIGSGAVTKLADIFVDRWRTARGKKKDAAQLISEYR